MEGIEIIKPVFAMGLLTLVMTLWMFAVRLPAMAKLNIDPQQGKDPLQLKNLLPSSVTQPAANHNHLFEQPTLFYAVCLGIAMLGHVDMIHVISAWTYVAFRVSHSIVHATFDHVSTRFVLFIGSTLALATMIIRESIVLF